MKNIEKYRLLKKALGETKMLTRLVTVRKECPFKFNEILVYSVLVYIKKKGITANKISKIIGLHFNTLKRILDNFKKLGLVVCDNNKYKAIIPPDNIKNWFSFQKKPINQELKEQFNYNWTAFPSFETDYNHLQIAIYCHLLLGETNTQVSIFLRCSTMSVSRVRKLKDMEKLKKSDFLNEGIIVRKSPEKKVPLARKLGIVGALNIFNENCDLMRKDRLPERDIVWFWETLIKSLPDPNGDDCNNLIWSFKELYDRLKTQHNNGRELGKYHHPNCYKLLCHVYAQVYNVKF